MRYYQIILYSLRYVHGDYKYVDVAQSEEMNKEEAIKAFNSIEEGLKATNTVYKRIGFSIRFGLGEMPETYINLEEV